MPTNTDSVDCRVHADLDAFLDDSEKPGAFFHEAAAGVVWVVLPNMHCVRLPVFTDGIEHRPGGPCWTLSGPPEKPTMRASIWNQAHDNDWHGFLTDGRLESC